MENLIPFAFLAILARLVGSAVGAKPHEQTVRSVFHFLGESPRHDRNNKLTRSSASALENTETTIGEGGLRFLGEKKSCKSKLENCRADLDECKDDKDQPKNLFTQMAETCKLKGIQNKDGKVKYELLSKDMDDETYVFSDRPFRIAGEVSTKDFFKNFDDTFSEETGGKPNGVVTFRHKDTDNFEGPLISVFVDAAYEKENGKYVYELSQSKDQEDVNALEDFFKEGDGKDSMVEYEMCSLFIDCR